MVVIGKKNLLVCKKITNNQGIREKVLSMGQEAVLMEQGDQWIGWAVFLFLFFHISIFLYLKVQNQEEFKQGPALSPALSLTPLGP